MWSMSFKSYDGNSLASDDYASSFAGRDNRNFQSGVAPSLISRAARAPQYATQKREERYLVLTVKVIDAANVKTLTDSLIQYFDTTKDALRTLVVTDTAAADWELEAKPVSHVVEGGLHKITLLAPDGVWYASSAITPSTWNVAASEETNVFTPGGTHPSKPIITITPGAVRSGSYTYRRFIPIYNQTNTAFDNYPIDLTDGGLDTATLVSGGKMQSDGDDLRVEMDGKQEARWLADMNGASTKVWINIDLEPKIELELEGALGAGAITEIDFIQTRKQKNKLKKLPKKGMLLIESEMFHYTGVNAKRWKVTGVSRAIKDTTAATHADGLTVRWVQHSVKMFYGQSSDSAPDQSDVNKPIIDLSSSTNTSWVYAEFHDLNAGKESRSDERKRTGVWSPSVEKSTGGESETYTGNRGVNADPATEMGMLASNWIQGNLGRSEKFKLVWEIYHPAGASTVAMDGEVYRTDADWAKKSLLQYSSDGITWTDSAVTFITPGSALTWTARSDSAALGATYKHLRFLFRGKIPSGLISSAENIIYAEVEDCTLTLDSSNTPSITLGAENTTTYEMDMNLRNETTDEEFSLAYVFKFGEAIEIDCENKTVSYLEDNSDIFLALDVPAQSEWMTLDPGSNTLTYTEAGITDVDIDLSWQDRDGGL
jgi:hypothetical protein